MILFLHGWPDSWFSYSRILPLLPDRFRALIPDQRGFGESDRPRSNMTGLSLMAVEFNGKRLELLQEILPGLRRVAVIGNPEHPGAHLERAFSEETAQRLGLSIAYTPPAAWTS